MIGWLRERLDTARLAQQRAERLVEENRQLRLLVESHEKENDRLNKVIDQVHAVVANWSQRSRSKSEIGV